MRWVSSVLRFSAGAPFFGAYVSPFFLGFVSTMCQLTTKINQALGGVPRQVPDLTS